MKCVPSFNHCALVHMHRPARRIKTIKQPFSEQEIIELTNTFLTHGVHELHVASIEQGRQLMAVILDSLHYYHQVACVAHNDHALSGDVLDVYAALAAAIESGNQQALFDFLLNEFHGDFLWIEGTHELLLSPWFEMFEQTIIDLGFDKTMPIVLLSYDTA